MAGRTGGSKVGEARILIADDDDGVRNVLGRILQAGGHEPTEVSNGKDLLDRVRAQTWDLLLLDVVFPDSDGLDLLREVKQLRPSLLVVMMTGFATVERVIGAYRGGAFDFIEKPVDSAKLLELAQRAVAVRNMGEKRRRMAQELESERHRVQQLRQRLSGEHAFRNLVGHSRLMLNLSDTIREVARTDSTVLIGGESGTGKGLVARTIHEASERSEGPFVEANCVVYSEGVLHSELFGHEKGAFTGAARTKKGRFELAAGGTLFLDEIGEISHATQLLLLRVLQDRTYERVGGEETKETDVRLIAATNRDLQKAIAQGSFRNDLFYRLNVIPLQMPALREHPEDIPLLAAHFLDRCAGRMNRQIEGFTPQATEALIAYRWPGNVRELENLVERLVVLNRSGVIELQDLPPALLDAAPAPAASTNGAGTLRSMERLRIIEALRETDGNKKKAARLLGIHRSTLYTKLRRYGLLENEEGEETEVAASETESLVTTG
jgi:two-component system response regulator HydG